MKDGPVGPVIFQALKNSYQAISSEIQAAKN